MQNNEDCLNRGLGDINYYYPDSEIFERMKKQYDMLQNEMQNLYGSTSINQIIFQMKQKNKKSETITVGDKIDQLKNEMWLDQEYIDELNSMINKLYKLAKNKANDNHSPDNYIPINFITIIYQLINYSGLENRTFQAPSPLNFSESSQEIKQFIKYYILNESFNKTEPSSGSRIIRIILIIIVLVASQ